MLAALATLSVACAQISAETQVRTHVRADAPALARVTRVAARRLEVRPVQRGAWLEVEVLEHRECREVATLAAVREERTVRRADAMIYWEYGIAAVALGLATFAFARPEPFAVTKSEGSVLTHDVATGHRLGGVFTAIGTGALIGGVIDSVRARDGVRRLDTTVTREGPLQPCAPPVIPAGDLRVELVLGERRMAGRTDLDGRVQFLLPDALALSEPAALHVGAGEVLPLVLAAPGARTVDAPAEPREPGGE